LGICFSNNFNNKEEFNMSKRFIACVLVVATIFSFSALAFATESKQVIADSINELPFISTSPEYLAEYSDGAKIVAAYRTTENGPIELSKAEFQSYITQAQAQLATSQTNALNQSRTGFSNQQSAVAGVPFTWYSESGVIAEYHRSSLKERVSNIVRNTGSLPATFTISSSKTQSTTSNYTLSSGEKSAFQIETGLSFSQSYTFTQSISQQVPSNKQCWMEFYPIMRNSYGYMENGVTVDISPYYVITSTKWTDIYLPRQLGSGQLDGVYTLVEKSL
jgi:hypothetical protein